MIQAVLWDIDGTLLDSEPHHFAAMKAVCARHGHVLAQAEYDRLLGLSNAEVFARLSAVSPMPIDVVEFAQGCTEHYVAHAASVPARPGGLELVDRLAARGVPQACVSNAGRRVVEANFRRIGRDCLQFALSRDDVVHGKPHPEPYLRAAERLGVEPHRCLAVEDSPIGARAAKAAGMITVAWPQRHDGSGVGSLGFDAVDHVIEELADLDWDRLAPAR